MRVLVWSQYFWPENFHINEVSVALVEMGHDVTVLTGKPNYPSGSLSAGYNVFGRTTENYRGVEVRRIPLLPRARGPFRLALNYLSFIISGYVQADSALKDREFDVAFVFAPSPLLQALPAIRFSRRAKIPMTLWVQDLWPEALTESGYVRSRILLRIIEKLIMHIYAKSDVILAQSIAIKDRLKTYISDPEKVHYFPNSIDPADFDHPGTEKANELAKRMRSTFAVTFTGNIGHAQSLETIIEAAEKLRAVTNVEFFIIGAGSRAHWLEKEASNRGLTNIVLAGQYPRKDMSVLMNSSSILLLTLGSGIVGSYTVPSKLQAYLAMGRPIVASADGETGRVLTEAKAGIACAAEDSLALAEAILRIRDLPPSKREEMGVNGARYFAANFSLHKLMGDLVTFLETSQQTLRSSKT